MKEYIRPTMQGEVFAANEYVTACYLLACQRGTDGNPYKNDYFYWGGHEKGTVSHSPVGTAGTCGDPHANRVITSAGGIFQSVGELNGEQGWLNGKLTYWIDKDGDNVYSPGDVVFWYTETNKDGYRRWNHWGVIRQEDPNRPNHS